MRRILVVVAVVAEFLFGSAFSVDAVPVAGAVAAPQQANWTSYLGGPRHTSFTTDAQISKAAASQLKLAWSWKPDPATMVGQPTGGFYSSPTVYNHRIYIGAYTGVFYALDETTGKVLWSRFLGFQPPHTCTQPLGFVSTAAVIPVPNAAHTGTLPAVYVAAPDGYMYSLNGLTGATRWRTLIAKPSTTVSDAFNWSSPTIVNGRVYIGFASNCDKPWIRGGVMSLDQNTGARLATWYGVPPGSIGGGVWTSAAVTSDGVFATTGSTCGKHPNPASACPPTNQPGDAYGFVRLDPVTLKTEAVWKLPPAELKLTGDPDWSSSPVVFNATVKGTVTRLVGACHKNGYFYVLRTANMTAPLWQRQIGSPTADGGDGCSGRRDLRRHQTLPGRQRDDDRRGRLPGIHPAGEPGDGRHGVGAGLDCGRPRYAVGERRRRHCCRHPRLQTGRVDQPDVSDQCRYRGTSGHHPERKGIFPTHLCRQVPVVDGRTFEHPPGLRPRCLDALTSVRSPWRVML